MAIWTLAFTTFANTGSNLWNFQRWGRNLGQHASTWSNFVNRWPAINQEAIQTAITNLDYNAFLQASSGSRIADIINTQDKFTKLVQAQNLSSQARKIRQDLGLIWTWEWAMWWRWMMWWKELRPDFVRWIGGSTRWMWNDAMITIINNKDYTGFQTLVANTPLATTIDTEAKFEQFVQMHEYLQNKDIENANKIITELGLEMWKWMWSNRWNRIWGGKWNRMWTWNISSNQ